MNDGLATTGLTGSPDPYDLEDAEQAMNWEGPLASPQRPAPELPTSDDARRAPAASLPSPRRRRRTPWRDNVEAMTMAIVMALLLKGFIVEAYKIPSGSMQPTLIGDEHAGIEDRILVDRLSYLLAPPERWDVAVFKYPLDRSQNFVKRIVGVGPEELRIEHGDLWRRGDPTEDWSILRRPERVQAEAWRKLDLESPETSSWNAAGPEAQAWTFEGRTIDATGPGQAKFRDGHISITDRYMDGYPESVVPYLQPSRRSSGQQMVGDLKLEGSVLADPELAGLVLEIREGLLRYRFEIPGPMAPADAVPSVEAMTLGRWREDDDVARESAMARGQAGRIQSGVPMSFSVQNLDDRIELRFAGQITALDVKPVRDQDSSVSIELIGGGARLTELMVFRDVHYLGQNRQQVTIPEGHYFMLGDNTQDSSDGREWQAFSYRVPAPTSDDPDATRLLMGNHRDRVNPRILGMGDPEGSRLRFVDEYGEVHWFRREDTRLVGYEPFPFVSRDLIMGRAMLVFWPLDPRRDIYRLKLVN